MQLLASFSFLLLSVVNILAHAHVMLILTLAGCVVNLVSALIAKKANSTFICSITLMASCSVLFAAFTIYGGNDGFAALWVILFPLFTMVVINFRISLVTCTLFQVFLVAVFWTPIRDMLPYQYNAQFCLRFPLFYFVTFVLGLLISISLRKNEYLNYKRSIELEQLNEAARISARIDPLTQLANRRCAYEEFSARFAEDGVPHCIVMGDIDAFKNINDTYGHEFGDEVLVVLSGYINDLLPAESLKVRWGGEEFLFALNAPIDQVYILVERLRRVFANHVFSVQNVPVHITITFGIAEYTSADKQADAIRIADNRLYTGKRGTKNCTVMEG